MKRLTSIALSFLLAFTMVGSCITVASADGTDENTTEADTTKVDTDRKGTLTLTKYDSSNITRSDDGTFTLNGDAEAEYSEWETKNSTATETEETKKRMR